MTLSVSKNEIESARYRSHFSIWKLEKKHTSQPKTEGMPMSFRVRKLLNYFRKSYVYASSKLPHVRRWYRADNLLWNLYWILFCLWKRDFRNFTRDKEIFFRKIRFVTIVFLKHFFQSLLFKFQCQIFCFISTNKISFERIDSCCWIFHVKPEDY